MKYIIVGYYKDEDLGLLRDEISEFNDIKIALTCLQGIACIPFLNNKYEKIVIESE